MRLCKEGQLFLQTVRHIRVRNLTYILSELSSYFTLQMGNPKDQVGPPGFTVLTGFPFILTRPGANPKRAFGGPFWTFRWSTFTRLGNREFSRVFTKPKTGHFSKTHSSKKTREGQPKFGLFAQLWVAVPALCNSPLGTENWLLVNSLFRVLGPNGFPFSPLRTTFLGTRRFFTNVFCPFLWARQRAHFGFGTSICEISTNLVGSFSPGIFETPGEGKSYWLSERANIIRTGLVPFCALIFKEFFFQHGTGFF